MKFLKNKLLDDDSLSEIKKLINCTRDSDWEDGIKTFRGISKTKSNLELSNTFLKEKIFKLTRECLLKNSEFNDYCFPKEVDNILITKTKIGGYYHAHADVGFNGHLSTTIFISNPEDYDGGELCMYIDDEEKKIKLDSGYGVTYPTGVIHRVNQVTSGERIVLVFWTKSIFKDPTLREICSELSSIKLKTEEERLIQPSPNFEDVVHQNSFKLTNILNKIIRTYGDI